MLVCEDIETCRKAVRKAREDGYSVGLVPTMGALHEGHMSLIRAARARCGYVAVTIFVNPTQFDPNEDLDQYPRPLSADLAACEQADVNLAFTPGIETMYPAGCQTTVHVAGLTEGLCGAFRPGHFDGVATIVTKLFNVLAADLAFFGEKDYQQLVMIQRMAHDLLIPIKIIPCPTVRESDGLAMSSRNAYLSADQRKQATSLNRALFAAADRVKTGERHIGNIAGAIRDEILSAGPAEIEYVDVVDPDTLEALNVIDGTARICLAVRIGSCRLIDNVGVTVGE